MSPEEKAVDTFIHGHNCCQAVVMTIGEQYGIDPAKWSIEMVGGAGAALALCKLRRVPFLVG